MTLVFLGVGEHGAVDGVGKPAFEGADGFLAGGTGFLPMVEVVAGIGPGAGLGESDSVNRGVELSVARTAEPVPLGVAGPDGCRRCSVVSGEGVTRPEASDPGYFADELGCAECGDAVDLAQMRGN